MAATPGATVLSVGSVTITANGGLTGDLLAKIMAASAAYAVVSVGAGDTSLPAAPETLPAGKTGYELVIQPGYTGPLDIPPSVAGTSLGYALVVDGATADANHITGGDPTTAIVGNNTEPLNYTGPAASVVGTGGGGTVDDTGNDAIMSFFGDYSVTAGGSGDTIGVDGGGSSVDVTGSNAVINTGGGSASVSSGASAAANGVTATTTITIASGSTGDVLNVGAGVSDLAEVFSSLPINASGGTVTVQTSAGSLVTLNATGGSQVVFDFPGNAGNLINAGPSTEYVEGAGDTGPSQYNASAGGADTIFALSAIDYSNTGGTANSLFFLGGAGVVTVSAAAAETVFGGTGGGTYSIGATSFTFVAGALNAGGADTLIGGTGGASVEAFGWQGENLTLEQAAGTAGNLLVPVGNSTMNASLGAGGNVWQIVNQAVSALPGGTFTGNASLVGSTAGSDLFVLYVDPSAATLPPAHTVDIANWQSSDTMFISDLGNANQSLDAADVATVNAFDAGSSHTLTLSDGTTIDFTNARPSSIAHA